MLKELNTADVEERRMKALVMMVNGITARLIKKHAPPEEIYKARDGIDATWRMALRMERARMKGAREQSAMAVTDDN